MQEMASFEIGLLIKYHKFMLERVGVSGRVGESEVERTSVYARDSKRASV